VTRQRKQGGRTRVRAGNGNAEANQQINHQILALLSNERVDQSESTIPHFALRRTQEILVILYKSKRARENKGQRLTNITPKLGKIADVVVPYEPVDEDDQVVDDR